MKSNQHIAHPARRRIVAAAAATLFAAIAWPAGAAPADAGSFSRIGAALPVAEFHADSSLAASARARASGFASVLAGERVTAGGSVMQRPQAQAQYQVRTLGSVRTLAEVPRTRDAVRNDPTASDEDVAARA